ncbi:MAG: Na+/H+ antiporter subunit D [Nitratireductor sp.]|nr:Na+/H+ antiporter subunit D [Nitratireductor sp.]
MAAESGHSADITHAMITTPMTAADWLIIAPVVLPIMFGAILLMLRYTSVRQAVMANLALAFMFVIETALLLHVAEAGPQTMTMGRWLPPFGISFSVDITGVVLSLAGTFVALMCGLYSVVDVDAPRTRYGFYPFLMLMMAGVNGAFLTGDVFNLYVWFEVLLISSFGLIVLGSEKAQLDGAIKYAFLNLIGTTLFLIATGYLYGAFGTLNMADITRMAATPPADAPVRTIVVLYLFAFAMKAAAFPLNAWLPASYHTPRIVVSALFAGLLTKVGVYAILRIVVMIFAAQHGLLAGWIGWMAAATMLFGVLGALAQSDIRRLLGFLVVSGIGSMLAGIALGDSQGLMGAIVYAVHSMVVMAALYLAAGIIGRRAGSFDMRELGGYYAASPWFAAGFLVLALAVAGMPPLSGFWPKLVLVKAAIAAGSTWLAAAILVTGLLTSLAVGRLWLYAFWRGGPEGVRDGAESWKIESLDGRPALATYTPFAVLVALVLFLGLYPQPLAVFALEGASGLIAPDAYIGSVFGETR